jgi:uncharacterized Ntn-hydrolase superfamily protein
MQYFKRLLFLASLIITVLYTHSQDTFSITAIDTVTGEVGSAGASCIDDNAIAGGCIILSDVKPGIGVIHTQAYWNPSNQNYASSLMDMGIPPAQIIDSLVANDIQNNPHIRQYGIIDFYEGYIRNAAYTGINCDDYKSHIIGANYTIQGNILLGQEILDSMESRFNSTQGQLACKLMAALQGAKVLGADTRCFQHGTSSLSAFLRIGKPGDPPDDLYLDLNVPSTPAGIDPIDSLQVLVDNWGGCLLSATGSMNREKTLIVFPNPAKERLSVNLTEFTTAQLTFILYNGNGEIVFRKSELDNQRFSFDIDVDPGLYFYQVSSASGQTKKGKIMIH